MNLERPFARLLAAVIVMIAVCFGASMAQAHEGHPHHAASAAVQVPAAAPAPAPVVASAARPTDLQVIAPAAATRILAVAAQARLSDNDESGCDGQCCAMGMACCHAAVTPALLASVPHYAGAAVVPSLQQDLLPSLTPEALPKPPRSFA